METLFPTISNPMLWLQDLFLLFHSERQTPTVFTNHWSIHIHFDLGWVERSNILKKHSSGPALDKAHIGNKRLEKRNPRSESSTRPVFDGLGLDHCRTQSQVAQKGVVLTAVRASKLPLKLGASHLAKDSSSCSFGKRMSRPGGVS